jgi:urease accessory protein
MPEPEPPARPTTGWQAQLRLQFSDCDGRTQLSSCQHQGPLRVQRVFHPEAHAQQCSVGGTHASRAAAHSEPCHAYLVHPPGGVVSGDELNLEAQVQPGAHALLTTPAAGKFYRRRGDEVGRATQTLHVNGGTLEWLPQENIFYPDCCAEVRTTVHLGAGARFVGWEIACLGLPAIGASLGDGSAWQCIELWLQGRPLLLERLRIERHSLEPRWGLAGCAVLGSWLAYPAGREQLDTARSALAAANCTGTILACTMIEGVLSCRAIAQRADRLKRTFIELWSLLRPTLLGRDAVAPRIWAT